MRPEDAKRLLGGFATGNLTPAEEQALYAAAMEDQELFDALANEQGLRDLLRDPAARARLLAALDEPPRAWWRFSKPAAVLAMAGLAAIAVVVATRKPQPLFQLVAVRVDSPIAAPAAPQVATLPSEREVTAAEVRQAPLRQKKAVVASPQAAPAAPPAPVTLAEAPKTESVRADSPVVGGVIGGVPSPMMARDNAAPPRFERAPAAPPPMRAQSMADAAPSARALFLSLTQPALRFQQVVVESNAMQAFGLRYSVVRREGEETATVRFTANANGYLSVAGATPVALTAMQPYTTPAIAADEIKVVFARQPQTSVATLAVPLTEQSGDETYVVSPTGAPLSITIPLKPR